MSQRTSRCHHGIIIAKSLLGKYCWTFVSNLTLLNIFASNYRKPRVTVFFFIWQSPSQQRSFDAWTLSAIIKFNTTILFINKNIYLLLNFMAELQESMFVTETRCSEHVILESTLGYRFFLQREHRLWQHVFIINAAVWFFSWLRFKLLRPHKIM